jgi:chromosome segregation ATPase
MDKINGRDPHYRAMSNGIKYQDYLSNNNNNLDEDEWKNKYNELKTNYNTLLAKKKAIDEEKLLLVNKDNKNLESIEKNNIEIADIKNKNIVYEKELESYKKNLSIINDDKIKIKKNCDDIEKEIKSLKEKNNLLLSKMNYNSNNNNEKIKLEINEIKKNNENLNYENKNLIMQKNMLTNQKNDIVKEIEKIKKEKENLIKDINSIKNQKNNKSNTKKKDNKIIEELKKQNDDLENEYNKIKDNYQYLVLENINLKEMYEKTNKNQNKVNMSTISANTSMMGYQISPEEYEEYDNLRKNKDENEALIMQLKSNNEAQELEINELKEKINQIKKRKKIK